MIRNLSADRTGRSDLVTRAADVTMAISSSAQREPSMEEILASIRRIIEDNDAGRKQPSDVDYSRAEPDPVDRTVIEVDAFRNELRAPPVESRPQPVEPRVQPVATVASAPERRETPEKKPLTLADVQAQIAAEASVTPAPQWKPEKPAGPERSVAEERVRIAIDAARAKRDEAARVTADELAVKAAPASDERAASAPAARAVETEKPVAASVPAIDRPAAMAIAAAKPAILSERAERKVAASFGELSEAFASRSKKTFDEMAEEMLRPMLRDWLDNNLPVLVERLVREEIERVARGSQ
jgi:cell pole-organizing protein PopZ